LTWTRPAGSPACSDSPAPGPARESENREADLNTAVTRELFRLLAGDPAYLPALTHPLGLPEKFTLAQRAAIANAMAPDLLISEHFNAGGGTGFEVFPEVPRDAHHPRERIHREAAAFARLLGEEMEGLLTLRGDRGVRYRYWQGNSYYGIIRMVDCPAVLAENAFIDSAGDMAAVAHPQGLAELARRQYRAVCRHFGTAPLEQSASLTKQS